MKHFRPGSRSHRDIGNQPKVGPAHGRLRSASRSGSPAVGVAGAGRLPRPATQDILPLPPRARPHPAAPGGRSQSGVSPGARSSANAASTHSACRSPTASGVARPSRNAPPCCGPDGPPCRPTQPKRRPSPPTWHLNEASTVLISARVVCPAQIWTYRPAHNRVADRTPHGTGGAGNSCATDEQPSARATPAARSRQAASTRATTPALLSLIMAPQVL